MQITRHAERLYTLDLIEATIRHSRPLAYQGSANTAADTIPVPDGIARTVDSDERAHSSTQVFAALEQNLEGPQYFLLHVKLRTCLLRMFRASDLADMESAPVR
jgi:hypothetical protein